MDKIVETLTKVGLSAKAAAVYVAALELGEATVLELSKRTRLKRTTIYYILEELITFGALTTIKRSKKQYFQPVEPSTLMQQARDYLYEFEQAVPKLEQLHHSVYPRPQVAFYYGVPGFKNVWKKLFASKNRAYSIITTGESFLRFVNEAYLADTIISQKKQKSFRSRQLITDSAYARKIIIKDRAEHRESRVMPPHVVFPFTTIICKEFVAFISPRHENMIFVVESESFAKTQQALFDLIWEAAPH